MNPHNFASVAIPLFAFAIYAALITNPTNEKYLHASSHIEKRVGTDVREENLNLRVISVVEEEKVIAHEIFVLESWCTPQCQSRVSEVLKEDFDCTSITALPEFRYIQARCDGIRSMSPHEVGELVVQKVAGVKSHFDNEKIPSEAFDEEEVSARSISPIRGKALNKREISTRYAHNNGDLVPWGLDRLDQENGIDGVFDLACFPKQGQGVKVYVLDTGCRTTHEDLRNRTSGIKVGRYNSADDDHGHGTHIAGVAAGTSSGVCKRCEVICVKTLDQNNRGTLFDVVDSVEYVLEQRRANPSTPAVVIMSLGGKLTTEILDIAVTKLAQAGIFPTIAAGNGYADSCSWTPARAPLGVTVAATSQSDGLRSSSNWGECINIAAPGSDIISASHRSDSEYVSMSGTSMAAPFVAGVAALLLGENPALSPLQVLEKMKIHSKMIQDQYHDSEYPMLGLLRESCYIYGFQDSQAFHSSPTNIQPRSLEGSASRTVAPSPSSFSPFSVAPQISKSVPEENLPLALPSSTQSASPVLSPSQSTPIWPSPSDSARPSVSSSVSASVSASASLSPSASALPSMSPSISLSASASVSLSASASALPSMSPSISPSASASVSLLASASSRPFMSSSVSPSASASVSLSPAASAWPSISFSVSPSTSASVSPLASNPASPSVLSPALPSASRSASPSVSSSHWNSVPSSASSGFTPYVSPSVSTSASESVLPSISSSTLQHASPSAWRSPLPSKMQAMFTPHQEENMPMVSPSALSTPSAPSGPSASPRSSIIQSSTTPHRPSLPSPSISENPNHNDSVLPVEAFSSSLPSPVPISSTDSSFGMNSTQSDLQGPSMTFLPEDTTPSSSLHPSTDPRHLKPSHGYEKGSLPSRSNGTTATITPTPAVSKPRPAQSTNSPGSDVPSHHSTNAPKRTNPSSSPMASAVTLDQGIESENTASLSETSPNPTVDGYLVSPTATPSPFRFVADTIP